MIETGEVMNSDHNQLVELLRTPGDLLPLEQVSESEFRSTDGRTFFVEDGVIRLLDKRSLGKDLGDKKFYEESPFGLRDWSDREDVEAGVEKDFKVFIETVAKDAQIVDLGCGSGRISNYLSMEGFSQVLSLDYSEASVGMVAEHSSNLCVQGNNLCLPLASDSFDCVISTGVIHHTPDPKRAFSECARVLKRGGQMYFKMRNIHSPYGYLFKTYGAVLRFCERNDSLKWVSELFGFQVYKLTRRVFYSHLPKRIDRELRGKYENLFIKDLISFFSTGEVKKMVRDNGLKVVHGRKTSFTHRQHFYVCSKISES